MTELDAVVIGAGPAGLSAALNLVRARRRVLVIDGNRPRNAATLASHGFLSRDGISPLELRRLGREELEAYPDARFERSLVTSVSRVGEGFVVKSETRGTGTELEVRAPTVLIATGLGETLPALPSIRAYYGTSLHSCVECDGFEKADGALVLIGETRDLAERALLISQWSRDLIVFTNGVGTVSEKQEAHLAERGIRIERREIRDVVGERAVMTGIELADGEVIARDGGFVRPVWTAALDFANTLGLDLDADGLIRADADGLTNVPGVFAAGDVTPPGPQQLIVAAGAGARAAAAMNRALLELG